ncbi:MAG: Cobalt-zinc-cadmium resistance protein CzcC precursor [Verrucomicrobia bacterium ADurb.Bin122]|mgnify:FL=1|nr:MAG: Cobalt-zinc-cadmium resistance protein CzcC precursor [Verrucomicrobia bacterium ADurb.Bin122]
MALPALPVGATTDSDGWVTPRPLGQGLESFRPANDADAPARSLPSFEEPTGGLSLRQALALALLRSPALAAVSYDVRLGEARLVQAGLRPNPEVSLEVENVLGTGDYQGMREAEFTLGLSQLVELGGKRAARIHEADRARELAAWDYEALRLDLVTQTAAAFLDVLGLQQQLLLDEDMLKLAETIAETVARRVEAAKALPVENAKAQLALASTRVERDQTQRALMAARLRLAAAWGSTAPQFTHVEGNLEQRPAVPRQELLLERLRQTPETARWAAEIAWREAGIRLENSKGRQDLTVSGGLRRFHGSDSNALTFGVSIPWPRYDRNQGGIREAKFQLAKAREEQRAADVRVTNEVAQAWQRLDAANALVSALKATVLPPAQQTFETTERFYREGRLSYLDVLDAQRTYFEVRAQYLRALRDYHEAVVSIERLIGEPLPAAPQQ